MRTLVFCPPEEVNPSSVADFLEQFYVLDSTKGPINVTMVSDGGWMHGGLAIYDAIQNANNRVTTTGLGTISSIAVLIFQAGHERVIGPNSTMFLHEASFDSMGPPLSKLRETLEDCERLQLLYNELISARTGGKLSPEEIQQMCEVETFLTAQEALDLGLADRILGQKPKKRSKAL